MAKKKRVVKKKAKKTTAKAKKTAKLPALTEKDYAIIGKEFIKETGVLRAKVDTCSEAARKLKTNHSKSAAKVLGSCLCKRYANATRNAYLKLSKSKKQTFRKLEPFIERVIKYKKKNITKGCKIR